MANKDLPHRVVARSVDERDTVIEDSPGTYRVMIIRPGRVVHAYNVDSGDIRDVIAWAETNSGAGGYSIAVRIYEPGSGVTLTWVTPEPEDVMRLLDA